jgi:GGDEF domain-containing protein
MERRPKLNQRTEQMTLQTMRGYVADFIAPELKHERRSLERAANYDELTGVANRRAFNLAIAGAEADPAIAIVVFDAQNFGKLNKKASHKFGDLVLIEMAAAIVSAATVFGGAERVFRYGGDEFVCFCPVQFAERFRDYVESAFGVRYPAVKVSLVGTFGQTFSEADGQLQARKAAKR